MAMTVHTAGLDAARDPALEQRAGTDAAAFRQLYDFYLPRIYGFIARRVDDRGVVEELTSTTFERGLAALRRNELRDASLGAYLYRVAASAVVDHARRLRKPIPHHVRASDFDEAGDAEAALELAHEVALRHFGASIDRASLRRAIVDDLAAAYRRLLLLTYLDGLDLPDACAALGLTRQDYALELHRALRAVRAHMAREGIDAA